MIRIKQFCLLFGFLLFCSLASEELDHQEITDWQARLELARTLSYLKKYDESLKEYKKLLDENPDSIVVKQDIAKVFFYQSNTDEAFNILSDIPPAFYDDETWLIVAELYRKNKNYLQSESIYKQYLDKYPQDNKVRFKLAQQLSWEKRYPEAISQYEVILHNVPNDIQVRRHYAQILTWMGRDEEAIAEWRKTLP